MKNKFLNYLLFWVILKELLASSEIWNSLVKKIVLINRLDNKKSNKPDRKMLLKNIKKRNAPY